MKLPDIDDVFYGVKRTDLDDIIAGYAYCFYPFISDIEIDRLYLKALDEKLLEIGIVEISSIKIPAMSLLYSVDLIFKKEKSDKLTRTLDALIQIVMDN